MDIQINRLKAPLTVQFELTYECNNYCLFCYNVWKSPYNGKNQEQQRLLSFKQICGVIDHLKSTGVFQIYFTGGEPTLHPDFCEILEYASSVGLRPSFITNANLITPELAGKVRQIGVKHCQVSLHGSDAQLHESLTQVTGSFKRATEGVRYLAENGISVNINMAVNRLNMHDMFETASLAKELGAKTFTFTRFVYSGAGNAQQETLGLSREDQDYLVDELDRIDKELGFKTRVLTPIPYCSIKEPEKIAGKISKCDGGITWCVITPSGKVRTCTNADETAGDLEENSLEEIWRNSPQFVRCQNLEHIPDECKTCEAFSYCGGGCRACAYNFSKGDSKAPDPCSNLANVQRVNARITGITDAILNRSHHRLRTERILQLEQHVDKVIPKISGHLMVRQEEFGILASNGRSFVIVNEIGLDILHQIDGEKTLAQIIDHFAGRFADLPRIDIENKLIEFIKTASLMKMVFWK